MEGQLSFFWARITLIEATLSSRSITYHYLKCQWVENYKTNLFEGGQQASKPHLINWNIVSRDRKFDGQAGFSGLC